MPPSIVLIEGNICAGKSTLSQALCNQLGLKLFLEPVQHNPFLELYYGEPKRYALVMQLWLLKQRYRTYVDAVKLCYTDPDVKGVVLDRSIYSDGTFAEQNFKDGNFTKDAYEFYKALVRQMMAKLPSPSLVLYLDVSAERCHERIMNMRKRECESGIPLQYLQGLDECHHAMVDRMQLTGLTVLSLNWANFGTGESMNTIAREMALAPEVQLSDALHDFIFNDASVTRQSQLREEDVDESERYFLEEQRAVEELMVATIDPSALTEGEVVSRELISNIDFNSSTPPKKNGKSDITEKSPVSITNKCVFNMPVDSNC